MTVLDRIEQQAQEAAETAARMEKMATVVRELGEDGLAELVALINATAPANGNGNGNGHTAIAKRVPKGREAVRRIVRERPGIWTYQELRAAMQREGWFTTDSGLEAAAKRLCDFNGEGRRIGKGRYVFPANYGEEDAIESDPSGGAMIPFPE